MAYKMNLNYRKNVIWLFNLCKCLLPADAMFDFKHKVELGAKKEVKIPIKTRWNLN